MLPSQIRSSIYSHGFHYKFQIKVECLQNSKQTLNSPKTQKGLSLNLSDYQELILQNVLNYEFNSNICKHKAFYLFKFIFSPLNSRSFVFLKYPKGVLICQQRNTFGKFWIVLGSHRVNSLIFINFPRYPVFFQFLYSSHHYVAYWLNGIVFSGVFLYGYLLVFWGVGGASRSVQCLWSDSRNLLRTWNSMEDFIQENWPGITTWDVNSLLSATINLTSAKANGVYFQLQEINLLHIIESNWSSLGGLCLNM